MTSQTPRTETLHGTPVGEHLEILPNGMQKDYLVLSQEERAKGFVRPLRSKYCHVGTRPRYALRDLTPEDREQLVSPDGVAHMYTAFEAYPPDESGVTGKFWTEKELKSGCGGTTSMGPKLCETYARDPSFYGATFCATCGTHFPVGRDGEFTWCDDGERVGT